MVQQYELKQHQKQAVNESLEILKHYGLVYIFGEPRIGKTLVALALVKEARAILKDVEGREKRVLVITKKAAFDGWLKYAEQFSFFDIINYESILKKNSKDYSFIIVDEAHNLGAFPKRSKRTQMIASFCSHKPIIFLSGTPAIESVNSLYSQLSVSSYSPFREFKSGYDFFRKYGIQDLVYIGNGQRVETYLKGRYDAIMERVDPITVKMTFETAGLSRDNKDAPEYIEAKEIAKLTADAIKTNMLKASSDAEPIPLENAPKVLQCTHRISGGFYNGVKLDQPKLKWLEEFLAAHKKESVALMCYFKEEQEFFDKRYSNVDMFSSTRYCEGVDLSGYDHYILFSFGYSGAKFVQLRDRIVNINKLDRKTRVIIPLLKNCVDSAVYEAVSQKMDFNSRMLGGLI